ncbi:hypothetical protein O0L34_g5 [Tuta absoluta]|nr:hypothetical protein O0L34_g5 [Tuta absoluta]
MRIALLFICGFVFISSSFAWQPPERCDQSKRTRRALPDTKHAEVAPDVDTIATRQHAFLQKSYKDYKFPGVAVEAGCAGDPSPTFIIAAYNCSFHTYNPRILSSVACHNANCKLSHVVSTVDSYQSAEGYNWGVKISSKASFFDKTFEIGGEVSSGGTYTCTYTRGKTTTDTVECSVSESGNLQLYNVKTDMECDFGRITLEDDYREEDRHLKVSRENYFTESELDKISNAQAAQFDPCGEIIIDPGKISDRLFAKIMKEFPLYNVYTDMISWNRPYGITVYYMKKTKTEHEYTKIIPFTTEGGDSVFQYACLLSPFDKDY